MIPLYLLLAVLLLIIAAFTAIGYLAYLQKAQRNNRNQQANIQILAKKITPNAEEKTEPEVALEEALQEEITELEEIANDKPNIEEKATQPHTSEHDIPHLHAHTQETPAEKRKRVKKNWIWGEILGRDI